MKDGFTTGWRWWLLPLALLILAACGRQKGIEKSEKPSKQAVLSKYELLLDDRIDKANWPVYFFVERWWGVPHRLGGNTLQGVDCSGFVVQYFLQIENKEVPRTTMALFRAVQSVPINKLKTGDLVFFELAGSGRVTHVGIYLQNGRFVHASTSKGVRIDRLDDLYYGQKKKYGGRLP